MNSGVHSSNDQQHNSRHNINVKDESQIRNRTILRRPRSLNSNANEECPIHVPSSYRSERVYSRRSSSQTRNPDSNLPLQERRACSDSEECKEISHYKWALTGWSSCLPKNINADSTCGDGVRR